MTLRKKSGSKPPPNTTERNSPRRRRTSSYRAWPCISSPTSSSTPPRSPPQKTTALPTKRKQNTTSPLPKRTSTRLKRPRIPPKNECKATITTVTKNGATNKNGGLVLYNDDDNDDEKLIKTTTATAARARRKNGDQIIEPLEVDIKEIVSNAIYFTRKLAQARGKQAALWEKEDFVNIHNWTLWLCKHVGNIAENGQVQRDLCKALEVHGISFDALIHSEIALFDTLLVNPYLKSCHLLLLFQTVCSSTMKSSFTLLSERIALIVQRHTFAQELSKLVASLNGDDHCLGMPMEGRRVACARLMRKRLEGLDEKRRKETVEKMMRDRRGVEMLCRVLAEGEYDGGCNDDEDKIGEVIVKELEKMNARSARDLLWVLDSKLIANVCVKSFGVFQEYATFLLVRLKEVIMRWRKREEEAIYGGRKGDGEGQDEEEEKEGKGLIVLDSQLDSMDTDFENEVGGRNGIGEKSELARYQESTDLLKDPEIVMDDIEERLNPLLDRGGNIGVILSQALEPLLEPKCFEVPAILKRLNAMHPANRWKRKVSGRFDE